MPRHPPSPASPTHPPPPSPPPPPPLRPHAAPRTTTPHSLTATLADARAIAKDAAAARARRGAPPAPTPPLTPAASSPPFPALPATALDGTVTSIPALAAAAAAGTAAAAAAAGPSPLVVLVGYRAFAAPQVDAWRRLLGAGPAVAAVVVELTVQERWVDRLLAGVAAAAGRRAQPRGGWGLVLAAVDTAGAVGGVLGGGGNRLYAHALVVDGGGRVRWAGWGDPAAGGGGGEGLLAALEELRLEMRADGA